MRSVARRNYLDPSEAEDLTSEVKLRLIQDGYAALARFEGRSSLLTYYVTLTHRVLLDQRRRSWGRWRPSAVAARRGPLAVQLERLLHVEGLNEEEAVARVRRQHHPAESDAEMLLLCRSLPPARPRRHFVDDGELRGAAAAGARPDVEFEFLATAARVQSAIEAAVARLPPRDRLIVRLRFEDGVSIADIARMLNIPQKSLYRHVEDLLTQLRAALRSAGLQWADVMPLVEDGRCHLSMGDAMGENASSRPSLGETEL